MFKAKVHCFALSDRPLAGPRLRSAMTVEREGEFVRGDDGRERWRSGEKALNGVGKKERPKKKKTKAGEKNCLQNGKLCYNITMEPMVARL